HTQGGAQPLLDESLHSLAVVLEALTAYTHLDDPTHELDFNYNLNSELLGISNSRHLRDLPYLDASKDDRRPDVQPFNGATKEQDVGHLFCEKFAATEEQCSSDHEDDGTHDKDANRSWIDLASHDTSLSLDSPSSRDRGRCRYRQSQKYSPTRGATRARTASDAAGHPDAHERWLATSKPGP